MKMKTLLVGLVSGFLLSACGAPLPEEGADELGTTEGMICEGWAAGARRCSWKCTSTSSWYSVGVGVVGQNDCTEYARQQCGRTAYGTCWSF